MSTRSSIAVQLKDGSVKAVYCHFDGYLDGVGATLLKAFNSQAAAEKLVEQGDLSSIDRDGTVDSYAARGETGVEPKEFASMEEYLVDVTNRIHDNGYRYIFTDGVWKVWGKYGMPTTPKPVSEVSEE